MCNRWIRKWCHDRNCNYHHAERCDFSAMRTSPQKFSPELKQKSAIIIPFRMWSRSSRRRRQDEKRAFEIVHRLVIMCVRIMFDSCIGCKWTQTANHSHTDNCITMCRRKRAKENKCRELSHLHANNFMLFLPYTQRCSFCNFNKSCKVQG